MSQSPQRSLRAWGQWLLLNRPELYVMRLHVVGPAALLSLPLTWLWARNVEISTSSIPDPGTYLLYLLLSSGVISVYWAYLQVRQHPMLSFRSGQSGWVSQIGCVVCLLAINGGPFLFSLTLSERLATFAANLNAEGLAAALLRQDYRRSGILRTALQHSGPHSDVGFVALIAILAVEVAAVITLIRSLSPTRFAVSMAGMLAFLGTALMLTVSLSTPKVFLSICLAAYALCVAGFVWGYVRSKLSRFTAFATVACIVGAPLIPVTYANWAGSVSSSDLAFLLLTGLAVSLATGPVFQRALNRFQVVPQ